MEESNKSKRSVIWFLWRQGKKQADILREMEAIYGEYVPAKQTISKWVQRFEEGWSDVDDLPRCGAPKTSVTDQSIQRVRDALDKDRRLTIREISEIVKLPPTTVYRIVSSELNMTRVVARWVPKLLTQEMKMERVRICQQLLCNFEHEENYLDRFVTGDESWFHYYEPESKMQSSVWKTKEEPTPVKAKTVPSAGKRMATVFWDKDGILLIDWLPAGQTINSSYYIEVLKNLREAIKSQRRGKLTRGVLLQHDNARPHCSRETTAAIQQLGFQVVPHPAHSPDLAPSDYWLFDKMKQPLRGKRYETLQALSSAVHLWVRSTPKDFFAEGLEKLPARWHKCVSLKGEYVEKRSD